MKLALKKLLQAHPSIQVSTLLSGSLTTPSAKSAFALPTAFESIATTTLSTATATVTFSSIPATYTHLQIRCIARTNGSGTSQNLNMTINNDSGANYTFHQLNADGTSAGAYGEALGRTNCVQVVHITGSSSGASIFGAGIIDILDYTNTNKYRTVKTLRGQDQNASDQSVGIQSYLYTSTTAISRLDFFAGGGDLVQYTQIALYGIKGS